MYSLFSNEKLGMLVEEVRLREIRQEIERRRLADEIGDIQFDRVNRVIYGLGQIRARLTIPKRRIRHQKHLHSAS